ncbi:PREDICTED: E3 ubiquitin-protein ligase TRAIP-like isoform X2 [Cyphomyrmex costatus]|uniref:E3 ubiquitin-protein ligase TRAIP-like isoform X2 n=1 Tax=Cyphomyrmex costatus TaxID=456900 RepID=UPI0008521EA0|nr:PREDICTED: E3 ubiquitin-protein ligase TRAIP-like isoform X2 [Cyphomyrmex costatus]
MNIVCVICSELLTPSDDVFHTPCGHIFHYVCLLQWFDRSQTCPQCRLKATHQSSHRIYFNFSNDVIEEDVATLQNRIDNMNFQLKLKDKDLNNLTEDNKNLKYQTNKLKQKIIEVESEITKKVNAIYAYKEQIISYKQYCMATENDKKENNELKKKIEHLRNVQNLLDSSTTEVDDVISKTNDTSKLVTYITVLKGELNKIYGKNKELKDKWKNEQQKFMDASKKNKHLVQECAKQNELKERYTELEKQLQRCETEKISLQTQLFNMQTDAQECVSNKVLMQQENCKQESLKTHKEPCIAKSNTNASMAKMDISKLKKNDFIVDLDSTENIPRSKSQDLFSIKNRAVKRPNNNWRIPPALMKKSMINQQSQKTISGSGMSFDGFGGHAKYDNFPNPISNPSSHVKKIREVSKTNKSKLDMVALRTHSRNAH